MARRAVLRFPQRIPGAWRYIPGVSTLPPASGGTQPAGSSRRPWPVPLVGLALAAALEVLARRLDPRVLAHLPACPLHRMTGVFCPSCGATRALVHLLRGELVAACSANLLVVLGPVGAVLLWLLWPRLGRRPRREALISAAALVVLFGILRNLHDPAFAWLAP